MNDLQNNPKNKKTNKRRSVEDWRALVSGFADSDLSLAKYCEAHGVATSGFYNWRKRFEGEATESSPFVEMLTPKGCDTRVTPKRLTDWRIELSLGDDLILRLR